MEDPLAKSGIARASYANTCYMNSAIQLMYCMSNVRESVRWLNENDIFRTPNVGESEAAHAKKRDAYDKARAKAAFLLGTFARLDKPGRVGPLLSRRKVASGDVTWWNRAGFDAMEDSGVPTEPGDLGVSDQLLYLTLADLLENSSHAIQAQSAVTTQQIRICERPGNTKIKKNDPQTNFVIAMAEQYKPMTVQEKINSDQAREHIPGSTSCKDGSFFRQTEYTVDSKRSKYIVVTIPRRAAFERGSGSDYEPTNEIDATPGPVEMRTETDGVVARYGLIGAILFSHAHYIFARSRGVRVTHIYNDADVLAGPQASEYMRKGGITLEKNAVALLYRRYDRDEDRDPDRMEDLSTVGWSDRRSDQSRVAIDADGASPWADDDPAARGAKKGPVQKRAPVQKLTTAQNRAIVEEMTLAASKASKVALLAKKAPAKRATVAVRKHSAKKDDEEDTSLEMSEEELAEQARVLEEHKANHSAAMDMLSREAREAERREAERALDDHDSSHRAIIEALSSNETEMREYITKTRAENRAAAQAVHGVENSDMYVEGELNELKAKWTELTKRLQEAKASFAKIASDKATYEKGADVARAILVQALAHDGPHGPNGPHGHHGPHRHHEQTFGAIVRRATAGTAW
jgi:hypothetical protein